MKIVITIDEQGYDARDKANSLVEIITRILDYMVHAYTVNVEEEVLEVEK